MSNSYLIGFQKIPVNLEEFLKRQGFVDVSYATHMGTLDTRVFQQKDKDHPTLTYRDEKLKHSWQGTEPEVIAELEIGSSQYPLPDEIQKSDQIADLVRGRFVGILFDQCLDMYIDKSTYEDYEDEYGLY
ncbi:hypothetical protein CL622_06875 [archaeon]|nr:hypothetical protein [archaeon]|tara:strand:- start:1114 stop:1503 length:390 start_codon:yes stop_codon:yes gene_type:complete